MATRDLSAFFDDGALDYPGIVSPAHPDGKTYRVPSPDGPTGVYIATVHELAQQSALGVPLSDKDAERIAFDDDEERTLYQQVLGSAYQEMMADKVPWTTVKLVFRDAFECFGASTEYADSVLDRRGEAAARTNRAQRRAASKKSPTSTGRTRQAKGGSSSATASTPTPARTRARTSTRSSAKTPTGVQPAAKAAAG